MQATIAQAIGEYREHPLAGPLGEHFSCIWSHTLPRTMPGALRIVPDGCLDLQWIAGTLRVAGPDRAPHTEALPPGTRVFGLRFKPAHAGSWLGVPAAELVDRRVPLEDLWGARGRSLAARVGEAAAPLELLRQLEHAAPCRARATADMSFAFDLLAGGAWTEQAAVPRLARKLGLGERTLRRRCIQAFGYGPKTLERILRYQRFLQRVRTAPAGSIAEHAAWCGYADQAHLTRESRRLAGDSPAAVAASLKRPPDKLDPSTGA